MRSSTSSASSWAVASNTRAKATNVAVRRAAGIRAITEAHVVAA
jgi:hypothetical protein